MTSCVLPGCKAEVNQAGITCPDCVAAFGNMLRPCGTVLTADEIRSRDAYVERAYHAQRGLK
jgi:hypothetical protein